MALDSEINARSPACGQCAAMLALSRACGAITPRQCGPRMRMPLARAAASMRAAGEPGPRPKPAVRMIAAATPAPRGDGDDARHDARRRGDHHQVRHPRQIGQPRHRAYAVDLAVARAHPADLPGKNPPRADCAPPPARPSDRAGCRPPPPRCRDEKPAAGGTYSSDRGRECHRATVHALAFQGMGDMGEGAMTVTAARCARFLRPSVRHSRVARWRSSSIGAFFAEDLSNG